MGFTFIGHIRKLVWVAQAIIHVVGFLCPHPGIYYKGTEQKFMETFLKVWSILLLVIGGLEIIPLLIGGNNLELGQAVTIGVPMLVEAICVLVFVSRKNKED